MLSFKNGRSKPEDSIFASGFALFSFESNVPKKADVLFF